GGLLLYCFLGSDETIDLAARIDKIEKRLPALFAALEAALADADGSGKVVDFTSINLKELGLENPGPLLSQGLFMQLPNSSTNYNRKRAAFILKRYFCDDLTPIDIVAPE